MGSRAATAPLLEDVADGVLTLTLNRPERRNAIDSELRDRLAAAIEAAAEEAEVRALVITGAGGEFCAGGDLAGFDELHDVRRYRHRSHRLTAMIESLERLEKPVIAALDGVVTGAGLALALAADWRIAAPGTRILFREGQVGLVPSHGGLTRLVKLVGLARAQQALLGGEDLDAAAAARLGLLSELVADAAELPSAVAARAQLMLRRAPLSFAAAKRLLQLAADADLRSGALAESLAQTALLHSADHREGLTAARERRPPTFAGR